jgi:hypothetical protein
MRKADRNERERTVQNKDDFDEMDLDCDIDLGRDIGPTRIKENMVMSSNIKSRKRLDDISEDLSSIPSYDGGGRNARHTNQMEEEADNEVEQMIFNDIQVEGDEKDDLDDSERQSYFSSRIDGESSATINSEMMEAYQFAIRNAGGKVPTELQILDQHVSATS